MFYKFIKQIIFPHFCCHCGKWRELLCSKCFSLLELHSLSPIIDLKIVYLDQTIATFKYNQVARSLITELKYKKVIQISEVCAKLIHYCDTLPVVEAIIPVPLHKDRRYERGFNQAQKIAEKYAQLHNLPILNLLIKKTTTVTQASRNDRNARLDNLENVFMIDHKFTKQLPNSVLLVDDVMTTGNTLNQCARVLKESGIKYVGGMAVAH